MADAPLTVVQFRNIFPEFNDSSIFLDEVIEPWISIAAAQLNAQRWGTMYAMGVALFTAHEIVLQRQATLMAQRGGTPGYGFGVVSAKSINGVSVSYDTNLAGLKDGGDWNLTIYGLRFLGFARMFGAGGQIIVGADAAGVDEGQLLRSQTFNLPQF